MKHGFLKFKKLERTISSFGKNRRGTMAVLVAIASLPIMASVGIAIDIYRSVNTASALQSSVDAAALAAASSYGAPDAQKKKTATDFFNTNGYGLGASANVETEVNGEKVTVTARSIVKSTFTQIIGVEEIPVAKSATAVGMPRPVCILSLSPNADAAIRFQGNPSLQAPDCVMHANSRSSSAILGKGSPTIHPLLSSAVGGIEGTGFVTATRPNAQPVADPFRGLPQMNSSFCIPQPTLKVGHHNLSPGVYCDLKIGPHADVDFAPGLYVIKGAMDIQPNAELHGKGVTFDLAGIDSYFWLSANSNYDISAPDSGPYQGLLIRLRGASEAFQSRIYGGGDVAINGTIYAPLAQVHFQGGASASLNATFNTTGTALIADKLLFRGNVLVTVNIVREPRPNDRYVTVIAGARLIE